MKRSLVIGKFYPFHKGHSYLINYACSKSDEVTVLVCDSPAYSIPAELRRHWIQQTHPSITVRIIPDIGDDTNSQAWASHTLNFLGYTPDAVFSSEDYGIEYAKYMNTTHHMVDKDRVQIPISGTRIRNNRIKEWKYLDAAARSDLTVRIVVVGAESTGTTTLSHDLSRALNTPWVSEYGRQFSESVLHTQYNWHDDDFIHIAHMQQAMERYIAGRSNGMIICDTNATATLLWQERYMGRCTKAVKDIAAADIAHHYIITGNEIPFVQDGTRDGEHIRHSMHDRFVQYLQQINAPFTVIRGDEQTRLHNALSSIDSLDFQIG